MTTKKSIAQAVKEGPIVEKLSPIDLMVRQLGVSKITAKSFLASCSKETKSRIEQCCKDNDRDGAATAIYEERNKKLVEVDKAVTKDEA